MLSIGGTIQQPDVNLIYRASVTSSVRGRDMSDLETTAVVNAFKALVASNECQSFVVSTERGEEGDHRHKQGYYVGILAPNVITMRLKAALMAVGCHTPSVLSRLLTGKNLHTHLGLIGYVRAREKGLRCVVSLTVCLLCRYVTKDKGEPHYEVDSHGITAEEFTLGVQTYLELGAVNRRSKSAVTPVTIFPHALRHVLNRASSTMCNVDTSNFLEVRE